jgi:hypothetical protein
MPPPACFRLPIMKSTGRTTHRVRRFLAAAALTVAIGFPWATLGQTPAARPSASCGDSALPAPVNEALKTNFAGWRPLRVSDMDGDDPNIWRQEHAKECPGIAQGHFENMESVSYALLLLPATQRGTVGQWQIVISERESNATPFVWKQLERCEGKDCFAPVIYKEPPGKYVGFDETKSIHIKLDGIGVEFIQKGSYIYYWWQGRYHKFDTSD